jgi:hypothetical protein
MAAQDRNELLKRWDPLLEGISDDHIAYQTARLFENQAKEFTKSNLNEEALSPGATTTGKIGTFQKFAFPLIRRTYPELVFNKIGATQTMDGPVSQIFYMGNSRRVDDGTGAVEQTMYSKFNITPRNLVAESIKSASGTQVGVTMHDSFGGSDNASALNAGNMPNFDLSNVLNNVNGSPSTTMGGKLASFPLSTTILGYSVSSGERLRGQEIPEVNLHIQKQTVQARERKMRALWTLEAAQDLKAYHNLDMEAELTDLLSKEMNLEIDRELIEDIRMIAYGPAHVDGWYLESLYQGGADNFPGIGGTGVSTNQPGGTFVAGAYEYDFSDSLKNEEVAVNADGSVGDGINRKYSNVYVMDIKHFIQPAAGSPAAATNLAPRHLGEAFSNVLALINFASTDIYRTTLRGAGNVLITSPVIASMLESAAKLEGGIDKGDGPTNTAAGGQVQYVGKFAGKYDLIVDPMFPEDEIIVGYKGANAMDAGFFYCPYIPLQPLDTVVDPETFQPRKGILTRYGKVAVQPASRFYRVIRIIGLGTDFLTPQVFRNTDINGASFGNNYSITS